MSDHLPACPRCGDLNPQGSIYCLVCGTKLIPRGSIDLPAPRPLRFATVIATLKAEREAPAPTNGTAA